MKFNEIFGKNVTDDDIKKDKKQNRNNSFRQYIF